LPEGGVAALAFTQSMNEQRDQDDDRDWNTEKEQQQ
jgi:hypothetical protein